METEPARWSVSSKARITFVRDADGDGVLVVGIGEYLIRPNFEASARREDVDDFPTVEMAIDASSGRPVITALGLKSDSRFSADPDGRSWSVVGTGKRSRRPITASLLRELPLARLAKYAMLGVASRLGPSGYDNVVPSELRDEEGFYEIGPDAIPDLHGVYYFGDPEFPAWDEPWTDEMQELASQVERLRAPRRRNRINDELLDRVARVYRQAIDERRPPKKAVQEAMYVSEATAGRYIMKARTRGFLGSTSPGRKGEVPQ
jgi:hypothetical protein